MSGGERAITGKCSALTPCAVQNLGTCQGAAPWHASYQAFVIPSMTRAEPLTILEEDGKPPAVRLPSGEDG